MLPEVDVFLPNDDEAAALTGLGDPVEQAERFREAGARTVVITQGDRGSLLIGDGVRMRAGTYPTQFVGGTGAGDAFDAGHFDAGQCQEIDIIHKDIEQDNEKGAKNHGKRKVALGIFNFSGDVIEVVPAVIGPEDGDQGDAEAGGQLPEAQAGGVKVKVDRGGFSDS